MVFKLGVALVVCLLVNSGNAVKCRSCGLVFSEKEPTKDQLGDADLQDYTKIMYSGIFQTCEDLQRVAGEEMAVKDCRYPEEKAETNGLSFYKCHWWYGDGDLCCSTIRYYTIPFQLPTRSYVVHLKWLGSYQYAQMGFCGKPGDCKGRCIEHWVASRLLVSRIQINNAWDFFISAWYGWLRFETYYHPGYCKCV